MASDATDNLGKLQISLKLTNDFKIELYEVWKRSDDESVKNWRDITAERFQASSDHHRANYDQN